VTPDEFASELLETFLLFERRRISECTKAALDELRSQGVKLGRPRTISDEAINRMRELRNQGYSYGRIARTLTEEGIPTPGGGKWFNASVYQALKGWGLNPSPSADHRSAPRSAPRPPGIPA